MNKYFFVLGRNSTLSIAEIISVLNLRNIDFFPKYISSEVLIISTDKELKLDELIKTLGGTIKVGRIMDEVALEGSSMQFYEIFSADNLHKKYLSQMPGKLHFGVSLYNAGGSSEVLLQLEKRQKDIDLTIKDNLKKEGIKSGFVQIKDRFLSSVSVAKNKLITQGAEIVLILTPEEILIGKTLAVQEFEEFSLRDYFRPAKDKRSGIMPPKLARMMINLAAKDRNSLLLDPFCGSGTILQEAIFLGYKNICGSDISDRAISDTTKNIDWLYRNFPNLPKTSINLKILKMDVRQISTKLLPNTADVIVTEPYLGPPLYKKLELPAIVKILSELSRLYIDAFVQFAKILKSQGRVLIVFPVFETEGKVFFVEILDKLKNLGFVEKEFFPQNISKYPTVFFTPRKTILYYSREQFVKREIISFQKI
ncbi:hypothetical protein HZB96_00170 [Candidatus Gottesmanbacteria bacterium]|nr:hypothetical protein [Candidatus Gottesmanbacteria bacterium]MBI5452431.1 hypothetical protein [Candidatus Gottesmanbacteria bacterium]